MIRHDGRRQAFRLCFCGVSLCFVRTSWALAAVAAIGLVVGLATLGVLPGWFHRGAPTVQSGAGAASRHGERVINPTVNEGVVTDLSVLRELSAVALDAQTSDVEKRLRQLEGNPPRQFYQSGQTDWPEEVNGIQRELSRLEQPAEFLPNSKWSSSRTRPPAWASSRHPRQIIGECTAAGECVARPRGGCPAARCRARRVDVFIRPRFFRQHGPLCRSEHSLIRSSTCIYADLAVSAQTSVAK